MDHQQWRKDAVCRDLDPVVADTIFFVTVGQTVKKAKMFCAGCPVKRECLNYAVLYNEDGFYAGTTKEERDALAPLLRDGLYANALAQGFLETRDFRDWGLPDKFTPTPLEPAPIEEQYQSIVALEIQLQEWNSLLEALA